MSDDEEKALFCVRYTFDIRATEEGYVVHRSAGATDGAAEDTFVVASIDGYEPLNEAAEKMKHNALLGAGWRPSPKGGAGPGVRAHELLAAGHNAFEVVMKGLAKLTKRCGISLIIDQHSPLYERKCILKTEYRSGPSRSSTSSTTAERRGSFPFHEGTRIRSWTRFAHSRRAETTTWTSTTSSPDSKPPKRSRRTPCHLRRTPLPP